MCRPASEGGRRCAAHHPATLAAKFIALHHPYNTDGLVDAPQIDYAFKALRESMKNEPPMMEMKYHQQMFSLRYAMESNPALDDNMKGRIIKKLEYAGAAGMPDPATAHAVRRLMDMVEAMNRQMRAEIQHHADLTGKTFDQARADFIATRNVLVSPPATKRSLAHVLDPRTREAFKMLNENIPRQWEQTPRIAHQQINHPSGIISAGYDPEDGRLEVNLNNGYMYSYRGVPQSMWQAMQEDPKGGFDAVWMSHDYDYDTYEEAQADGYRIWCQHCSRYRLASGHACRENRGATTNAVVTTQTDKAFQRSRNLALDGITKMGEGASLTPPAWANRRGIVTPLSEDGYVHEDARTYTDIHNSNKTYDYSSVYPSREAIIAALDADPSSAVEFKVGFRKPDTSAPEGYVEITKTIEANYENGNRFVRMRSTQEPRCSCPVYQRNGKCRHLNPDGEGGASTETRLVNISYERILGEADDGKEFETYLPNGPTTICSSGEEMGAGLRSVSASDANAIIYTLNQNPHDSVIVRAGDEGDTPEFMVSMKPSGIISVQGKRGWSVEDAEFSNSHTEAEISQAAAQIQADLNKVGTGTGVVRERLAAMAAEDMKGSWETNPETRAAYMERFGGQRNGYLNNPDEFLLDYNTATSYTADTLPFHEGPVTGGYLSTGPGPGARGFGIEIEFDGDTDWDEETAERVATMLHEAGLSSQDTIHEYHADNDFTKWRVEHDSTVGGEIVSPVLYDNEESWRQVAAVCDIVKRAGGRASVRTGSHVHIGAEGMSVDQRRGVLAAAVANQDVLRRVATDPSRKVHRSASSDEDYSAPFENVEVAQAYNLPQDLNSPHALNPHRYRMVNFQKRNTVEFRDADGSLNPSHIQANVMMAAAVTQAGQNGRWDDIDPDKIQAQQVGAGARREAYIQMSGMSESEKTLANNISLMTSLDALFPDREARQRVLNVAVQSGWQEAR